MPSTPERRGYLDWLRGVGVLIMIEAHTLDSWTQFAERSRPAYRWAIVVGGFGAPMFLFLAGVALALAAGSRARRGLGDAAIAARARRRAWQVFGLAFLFRLQSLVISGGGLRAFLKVDILNVMGLSMLLAAFLWQAGRTPRGRMLVLSVATVLAAMLTPPVRSSPPLAALPDVLEAYVRPVAGRSTFTMLPWAGFLFAGAVAGIWLDVRSAAAEARRNAVLGAVGVALGLAAYAASYLPPIYRTTSYWTSSPTFFFVRLGIIVGLVPAAFAWSRAWTAIRGTGAWSPVREFGVASLFVYWIHVEMVYGVVSTPLHHALTLEQAAVAMALFAAGLFGLVRLKGRWEASRGDRRKRAQFALFRVEPTPNRPESG